MLILPLLPVARRAQTLSGLWLRARCTGSGQPGWPRPRLLVRGCSVQWQLEGLFCAVAVRGAPFGAMGDPDAWGSKLANLRPVEKYKHILSHKLAV